MVSNDYRFTTRWRVEGTCGEVADILSDPLAFPRWWPSVYIDVRETAPPGSDGLGRRIALVTTGWLPYTLRWEFVVVESRYPHRLAIAAAGDFDGRGVWTFEQAGRFVDITFDWRLRAQKPLLRRLSFLLKSLFASNHRWAMAQGEQSLRLELARRRATSAAALEAVAAPPAPITYSGLAVLGGAALVVGTAVYLIVRAGRRGRAARPSYVGSGFSRIDPQSD
ncbi:MAG: SRPBCC family protein [Acidobacteriota bacterium]